MPILALWTICGGLLAPVSSPVTKALSSAVNGNQDLHGIINRPSRLIPYGARTLEETDLNKLQDSFLKQIHESGKPLPKVIRLYPPAGYNAGTTSETISGSSTPPNAAGREAPLTKYFVNRPPCETVSVSSKAYNAFALIHEFMHYIAFHTYKDKAAEKAGVDLNQAVFSTIVHAPSPQTYESYVLGPTFIVKSKDKVNENILREKTNFAFNMGGNFMGSSVGEVPERIADAGATLYVLSNYSNTEKTIQFLKNWTDWRDSMLVSGVTDDTRSSIVAAIDAYVKNSKRGITFDEAAKWASNIIVAQPEFNREFSLMFYDVDSIYMAQKGFERYPADPYAILKDRTDLTPENQKAIRNVINRITRGRDAFCRQNGIALTL